MQRRFTYPTNFHQVTNGFSFNNLFRKRYYGHYRFDAKSQVLQKTITSKNLFAKRRPVNSFTFSVRNFNSLTEKSSFFLDYFLTNYFYPFFNGRRRSFTEPVASEIVTETKHFVQLLHFQRVIYSFHIRVKIFLFTISKKLICCFRMENNTGFPHRKLLQTTTI